MEPLPLFQFWRIPSDKNIAGGVDSDTDITFSSSETTNSTNGDHHDVGTDEEDSFFDLEFTAIRGKKHKDLDKNNDVLERKVLPKPRPPISCLESPPKLRLYMLLRNSKSEKTEAIEEVPIFSLLNRGNSPRSKLQKQRSENASSRFPKFVVQKYLKLIKPLYSRASRITETAKFSDEISHSTLFSPPRNHMQEKRWSRQASNGAACKQLGKSRSASSAVRSAPFPARRDDSLLLQDEGILSAILHCKRSYNSSSVNPFRNSMEEVKTRTSI